MLRVRNYMKLFGNCLDSVQASIPMNFRQTEFTYCLKLENTGTAANVLYESGLIEVQITSANASGNTFTHEIRIGAYFESISGGRFSYAEMMYSWNSGMSI